MPKMIFEIEVDVTNDSEKFTGFELLVLNGYSKDHVASMMFHGRPQRVREGKHLFFNNSMCKVVKVGE